MATINNAVVRIIINSSYVLIVPPLSAELGTGMEHVLRLSGQTYYIVMVQQFPHLKSIKQVLFQMESIQELIWSGVGRLGPDR